VPIRNVSTFVAIWAPITLRRDTTTALCSSSRTGRGHRQQLYAPNNYWNDSYLMTCNGNSYGPGYIQVAGTGTSAMSWTRFGANAPTTADDCARLCNWLSAVSNCQWISYQSSKPGCIIFEWMLTSGTYICNLWALEPDQVNHGPYTLRQKAGVKVAGISRAGSIYEFRHHRCEATRSSHCHPELDQLACMAASLCRKETITRRTTSFSGRHQVLRCRSCCNLFLRCDIAGGA
jgi:hypothetical protein